MSDDLEELVLRAHAKIADLESRFERSFRYGKILDASDIDLSDPTNPVARIHHDDDDEGQPVKGPFVRYATWAGDRNQHTPPSVGQQFLHLSPDGEMEAGLLIPLGHSNNVKSPSTDPKTYIDQIGKTKNTQLDGSWKQEVNNATISMTDGQVVITAGNTTVTFADGKVTFDTKAVRFGKNASKPMSMQGTVDSRGDIDSSNFSSIAMTE